MLRLLPVPLLLCLLGCGGGSNSPVGAASYDADKSAQQALALNPGDKATQGGAYRCLGYGYAYLGDRASAVKWLEKYTPFCTNDCAQVHAFTGK